MRKLMIASVAALAATSVAPAALAQDFYGSIGYSALDGEDATLSAITARGGAFFTENFGVELEGSFGAGGETVQGVELELGTSFVGYAVGRLPLGENTDLLGRLGYGSSTISGTVPGFGSADVDLDGFAFGVGVQHFFTGNFWCSW